MEKKKSLKGNAIFNMIYKIVMYAFPLIIAGYISRVLLADGVGKASFAQNVSSYFISLVALGIPTYGTREIAKCNTRSERDRVFSSLFFINSISTIIFTVIYYLMVLTVPFFRADQLLFLIAGIQIAFNFISIDWFYQGLEDFQYIAVRSFCVKAVSLLAIFLFVRSRNDVWKYLLITCIVNAINNIVSIIYARHFVKFNIKEIKVKQHFNSVIVLFATAIAIELYTKIDTTFIGIMLNDSEVGYYTYANRIIQMLIGVFAAINTVMFPRLSSYYKSGNESAFSNLVYKTCFVIFALSVPSAVGIFILADEIVLIMFGVAFKPAVILLRILSPLIVIMSVGNLIGAQAILAIGKEKQKFIATIIAGILNCAGTPLLISVIGTSGACIASVLSETFVLIVYVNILIRSTRITIDIKNYMSVIISSFLMASIVISVQYIIGKGALALLICIVSGMCIYFLTLILTNKFVRTTVKDYLVFLRR